MNQRLISNSETSSWLHCNRKYYYEYVLDLEKKPSENGFTPLSKGTFVHAMLEAYYAAKQIGLPEELARAAAMDVVIEWANLPGMDMVEIGTTKDLVFGYFDKWQEEDDEKYEIIAVESKYKADITDRFALVGTIDLVLREIATGRIVGVDHKTSYNFWSPDQINTAGQFVKYIVLLRASGLEINSFMVNQIRTRPLKEGNELFVRAYTIPTEARIRNVLKAHIRAGNDIMDFREAGADKDETTPIYDKHGCANCDFLELCDADTEGSPIQYVIQSSYQKRTSYGYNMEDNAS